MNECCGQKHLTRNGTRPCYSLIYVKLYFHIQPKIDHNKANCQVMSEKEISLPFINSWMEADKIQKFIILM